MDDRRGALLERVDMAVFGAVPDFVRASIRIGGAGPGNAAAARALLERSGRAALGVPSDDPRLAVWRAAYVAVGLAPDTPPPPLVLQAWATRPGGVPTLGTLPDLVNAFSLQQCVPVSAYDLGAIAGTVWLRPARGVELFEPLGGGAAGPPDVGEVVLADDGNQVLARRWHGMQGRAAAARAGCTSILVHIDLLPPLSDRAGDIGERFCRLATGFLGGRCDVRLLTRRTPSLQWEE